MQSTSNKKTSRGQRPRKDKRSGAQKPPLMSKEFQDRVERLDKLMALAAKSKTPTAPAGFELIRKDPPGTLEQVGHEADAAWAGVKRIMQLLNVEEKYVDYNSAQNVNYTGFLLDLAAGISQGVGRNQRTGDSLKITRIAVKCTMTSGGANSNWTWVVGKSKDAMPALSDIWDLSGATSARGGLSFPNHYELSANKVLHREHGYLVSGGLGSGNMLAERREHESKHEGHVVFSPATTTVVSGAIWFSAISDLNASVPIANYMIRVYFVDN